MNDEVERRSSYEGCVLLEYLDSALMDGTLTRLSIEGGKSYLEVKQNGEKVLKDEALERSAVEDAVNFLLPDEDEIIQDYESNFDKEELMPVKDASEHGFRIYKVEEPIREIALKIMSSQELIHKFTAFLIKFNPQNERDNKTLNMTLLNNIINVIKDLIGFIYNCDYHKIVSSGSTPHLI